MTLLTAFEIEANYPEEILIETPQGDNGKFAGYMYRLKEGNVHKLMVSSEFVFNTAEEAKKVIVNACEFAIEYVNNLKAKNESDGKKD